MDVRIPWGPDYYSSEDCPYEADINDTMDEDQHPVNGRHVWVPGDLTDVHERLDGMPSLFCAECGAQIVYNDAGAPVFLYPLGEFRNAWWIGEALFAAGFELAFPEEGGPDPEQDTDVESYKDEWPMSEVGDMDLDWDDELALSLI